MLLDKVEALTAAEDIYRLRRSFVERFLRHVDAIRWWFNHQEKV
jgi:hypothetical protein